MANEQKKAVLANIILAFQHLQPTYYVILARQNLANNRPFANFYSVQYFPLYGTSSGEGAGQRLSRARPYPLQTKGEGLVKSLHTSRAPGRLECDKRNEYWMLACYWAETHAVDLSRAVDAVKKVAV